MSTPTDQLSTNGGMLPLSCDLVHPDSCVQQRIEMLVEVDFKWLMAGQGRWIEPQRLRIDSAYTQDCLQSALNSGCEPLRRCAQLLQNAFEVECLPGLYAA